MKTCLITGASGGVASALAQTLRLAGWRLALVSRDAGRVHRPMPWPTAPAPS
jgi:short-subunit dehydrogenase